ncbi:hypothetical protein TNIN_101461 [Trichonephila inaurata madagascariensis]|uniref:Uncharacterized protein n=1 Tax=Trichonephila inaurata madagascariensis TaxID=2747483 RepID=A0A8X7BSZ8_9ARAC|nr:hypothetical protein TNIN_101461 [Trichonephila inaurata madagascariensis]
MLLVHCIIAISGDTIVVSWAIFVMVSSYKQYRSMQRSANGTGTLKIIQRDIPVCTISIILAVDELRAYWSVFRSFLLVVQVILSENIISNILYLILPTVGDCNT